MQRAKAAGVGLTGLALLLAGCGSATHDSQAPLLAAGDVTDPPRTETTIRGFNVQPASLAVGEALVDRVVVMPLAGQTVRVELRNEHEPWQRTTPARVDAGGRTVVRVRPPGVGAYRVRLVAAGQGPATTVQTPFRRVIVSGERRTRRARYVYATADVGECGGATAATAKVIPSGSRVIAAGDLAYPSGSAASFASCYLPYYGKFLRRTFPVPGNHEYFAPDLAYFDVFGTRAGTPARPWYTVRFGAWRFLMLNSNCRRVGGCDRGSRQYRWLARTLRNDRSQCLAAVWHHPRWSSGHHGGSPATTALYRRIVRAGGDLLLSGHDHTYERFARKRASGRIAGSGLRQFVVGTGGARLYGGFGDPLAGSQVRQAEHHGVLRLRLTKDGYSWRFLATDGAMVDSGADSC